MAIELPFVRWEFVAHPPDLAANGGFYYAYTAEGASERVAIAVDTENNQLIYSADEDFVHDYGNRYPLGHLLEWPLETELIKWLDALIYYSFLHYSVGGVPRCWFLKFIFAPEINGFQMLPIGLQPSFQLNDQITWIVLKHGYRVWPISVLNYQMLDGWANFQMEHGLTFGCQIIFSCERQWIFNTTMFDQNGREISYNWSTPDQPWQPLHAFPASLYTSCLPSIIENTFSLYRFSCQYRNQTMLRMVFNDFLIGLIESFALEQLTFSVGNQSWTVDIEEDRTLKSTSFGTFCAALQLHHLDYIMVAVSWEFQVQLIVFQRATNREKIYSWF